MLILPLACPGMDAARLSLILHKLWTPLLGRKMEENAWGALEISLSRLYSVIGLGLTVQLSNISTLSYSFTPSLLLT